MKKADLTNKKIGMLTVLYPTEKRKRGYIVWKCKCDCGNEKEIPSQNLIRKTFPTRSCGCLAKPNIYKAWENHVQYNKGFGTADANTVYYGYKCHAKQRSLVFDLTKEDFLRLSQMDCYYCGSPPSNNKNGKDTYGEFTYNGIDRVDNTKGYTLDNCVTSCKMCNWSKRTLTQDEFYGWIKNVAINVFGVSL